MGVARCLFVVHPRDRHPPPQIAAQLGRPELCLLDASEKLSKQYRFGRFNSPLRRLTLQSSASEGCVDGLEYRKGSLATNYSDVS
jgi:hypothetical protein